MISRIEGKDFSEYVQWFRNNADEVESPELRTKVWKVNSELGELNRRLAGHEAERQEWAQKLDDLQGALVACESAHGVGSMCQSFFAKAARIIEECEHPAGGSPIKE